MTTTSQSHAPGLMPITVSHGTETVDMSVPSSVTLGELVPGLVRAHGRLDTASATRGFVVSTASGTRLDQSLSLPDQGVDAGAVLTLSPMDESTRGQRYDDIVEAVGTAVENRQAPWTREDSLRMSSHAAATLILIASVLLATGGTAPLPSAVVGGLGAALVCLAAAVIARLPDTHSALTLIHTAPVLGGCAAAALVPGQWTGSTLAAAGVGVLFGSMGLLALPAETWPSAAGPLVIGVSLTVTGILAGTAQVLPNRVGAVVLTTLLVLIIAAPWIAMAQVPVRVTGAVLTRPVDTPVLTAKVARGEMLVLSLKAGACLTILLVSPLVAVDGAGLALLTCTGTALMLSTRSLRSRAEVLIGVLAGMILILLAAVSLARQDPAQLPLVVGATVLMAVLLLAANVVGPRMRPWLTRAADALSIASLLAVPPLTALVWGVL